MVTRQELEQLPNGVKPNTLTADEIALIVEYYPKKNKEALAKAVGISPNKLRQIYKEHA